MGKLIHQVEKCIGCGNCAVICPEHFEMEGTKAHLKESDDENGDEVKETEITDKIKQAASSCPVQCIKIEK